MIFFSWAIIVLEISAYLWFKASIINRGFLNGTHVLCVAMLAKVSVKLLMQPLFIIIESLNWLNKWSNLWKTAHILDWNITSSLCIFVLILVFKLKNLSTITKPINRNHFIFYDCNNKQTTIHNMMTKTRIVFHIPKISYSCKYALSRTLSWIVSYITWYHYDIYIMLDKGMLK